MPDQKPPRLHGDERETLTALLQYQRESLIRKVSGVDELAARESVVGSRTTLFWLVEHMARAEHTWVVERFAGEMEGTGAQHASSVTTPPQTLEAAVDLYRSGWARVDAIVDSTSDLATSCRGDVDEPEVNLRWVLAHLLEETARHAGHADILRELIDGQTGR